MVTFLDWGIVPASVLAASLARAAGVVLAGAVTYSHAQQTAWQPERPVEIVVPTTPGGAIDTTARLIQRILQNNRIIEVPVVVVNKPGGGQALAMTYLDQRAGDPHHLLNSTMSLMTNHIQGRSKANYTDYTPVAILFGEPMTLVVKPDSPLKTGRDIQEKLKKDPQSLSIAVGLARGGAGHLTVTLVTKAMGVDAKKLKTVVFQANADAMTALMGGHVDFSSMSLASAWNAAQQGKLRIIAITSDRRLEGALAEIPTWKEVGFDVVFTNIRFMLGPKGMSPAQTAYWDGALERVVQSEEWKDAVQKNHWAPEYLGSRESPQRLAAIYKQLRGALVDAGLVKE